MFIKYFFKEVFDCVDSMKQFFQILFLVISSTKLSAQKKDFSSSIQKGYDTLYNGFARGDLNKDGIEDVALVLFNNWESKDNWIDQNSDKLPKRLLVILFGTQSGYQQAAKSSNAIMCKSCGGVFGDPFAGISISNNVLEIYHYGGSAWRWSYTHKFRFQNNNWFLIGKTSNSFWSVLQCEKLDDFAGTNYEDVNFISGQYESKKISEDCKLVESKKGKKKVQPLVSLTKFKIDN